MKITLVTVCFKSVATLRTAMESVWRQRGVAVEYIVVDGGSTDGTVEILEAFEKRVAAADDSARAHFSFRWLSERDKGMYDAMNKGIRMATGDVIGILNADDVLAADDTLAKVAAAFDADPTLDGTYADIRFVREIGGPTVRYCSGRLFRPWMFRFGTQTAHPSTFFRRGCFSRWGEYSLDYGMYADFDLLLRFIWNRHAKMRYLPLCTTEMLLGGASTDGWRTTLKINRTDRKILRDNGRYTNYLFLYARYLFKLWGFVVRKNCSCYRPMNRSSPSSAVAGCGGQPGMKRSGSGTTSDVPFRTSGEPA